jgi:hypothetical protein
LSDTGIPSARETRSAALAEWRLEHLFDRRKDPLKPGVKFLCHALDFSQQFLVGHGKTTQVHKSPHACDVDLHSSLSVKTKGE